jgi:dihydrofolate reductase
VPIGRSRSFANVWTSSSGSAQSKRPDADEPEVFLDYARIWQDADKFVYSRTMEDVTTRRTRIERSFDPEAVRELTAASPTDVAIGGAELAGQALRAGLVDEVHLLLCPVVVGGGKRALPDGVRLDLELVGERRFANGVVHLHHRVHG